MEHIYKELLKEELISTLLLRDKGYLALRAKAEALAGELARVRDLMTAQEDIDSIDTALRDFREGADMGRG